MRLLNVVSALIICFTGYAYSMELPQPVIRLWAPEEAALASALSTRAEQMAQKMGLAFDSDFEPQVNIDFAPPFGLNGTNRSASYVAETQTIVFSTTWIPRFWKEFHESPRTLAPEKIAGFDDWRKVADHELGHALMDQISRRNGLGPYYTQQDVEKLSMDQRLGVMILSEGFATYVQEKMHPENFFWLYCFPQNEKDERLSTFDEVVYKGGAWLVGSIVDIYGERGVVWIREHPFYPNSPYIRRAAQEYQLAAFQSLGW
jgi:hypothetical protein